MSLFWKKFGKDRRGVAAVEFAMIAPFMVLLYCGPTIQVDILKHPSAWFPLKNPALLTIPLSFVVGVVVSLLGAHAGADDRAHHRRMHLGELSADQ